MNYDFSLQKIRPSIESFVLPELDFDPQGEYRLVFRLLSLSATPRPAGRLTLTRGPAANGVFPLDVIVQRAGYSGFDFFSVARFECRQDELATPTSWQSHSKLAQSLEGEPFPRSEISKKGRLEESQAVIAVAGRERRFPVAGVFSAKWALLEAVQRLAPGFKQAAFTCLDEVDQICPNHRLEARPQQAVRAAAGPRTYRGYLHTGAAMIPRALWVNEQGLLHFITSGAEGAILEEANGVKASFDLDYTFANMKLV